MLLAANANQQNVRLELPGTEVRCQNIVLKNYAGVLKKKKCNALLAVVETDINGSGSVTVSTKCTKAGCNNMVHHTIDF